MIKLDLKRASTEMVHILATFLARTWRANNTEVVVVSDKPEILALLSQQEPRLIAMLGVVNSKTLSALLSDEDLLRIIDGVSVRHSLLTADSVEALKERGLIVFAWTVNEPERMNELVEYGVDGIVTDNLAIMQLLGGRQLS
ncbi:MAG: hypothetical protein FJ012_06055 [Chloroflexi bacterium]|nr:hypothetical protein [Chloroflexota bacterium]